MPKGPTKFGAQLAAKIEPEALAAFVQNAEALGSTKDIVLRELAYAFNRACEGGRRPVMPFRIASPAYMVEEDRTVDATYITKSLEGGAAKVVVVPHAAQRAARIEAEIAPKHSGKPAAKTQPA